jgi:hypothetical protein
MRPGAAILQSRQAFATIPINPFANRPRADACGLGNGLRRLPALDQPNKSLSTNGRQTGILVDVHPVLSLEKLKPRQLQLPRSGPDGQPIESSHLGTATAMTHIAIAEAQDGKNADWIV